MLLLIEIYQENIIQEEILKSKTNNGIICKKWKFSIEDETIVNDIKVNDDENINVKSVHTYINALKKYLLLKIWNDGVQIFVQKLQ